MMHANLPRQYCHHLLERVDGDDDGQAVLEPVVDVLHEIRQALLQELELFPRAPKQRLFRFRGPTPVHLDGAYRGHEDDGVGQEAGGPALYVEELLHADVGAEAGLGHHHTLRPYELQGNRVGDYGGAAVGDVGEGPGVNHHRGALEALHEGRLDRVLQQYHHRARHPLEQKGRGILTVTRHLPRSYQASRGRDLRSPRPGGAGPAC
jgi:hypothetical protein